MFFENYVTQNNLTNNTEYFEGLYGDLKEKAFKNSHAFLLPSYYINEGQPLAVLEAMASGNVCVVTNYRLIPDMVDVSNGVFVEAKSPEDIAEKIIYLMDNTEIYSRMSKTAIVKYRTNYTFDIYCEKVLTLFENL
jgi:glycosyltransferase involved in cell wall biosynthesis